MGILDGIIASAPLFSRVVVIGVCMEPDAIRPAMAINKEIDLRFVVGYTPLEFRDRSMLAEEGECGPVVTGAVGLPGVERIRRARRSRDPREDPHRPQEHRCAAGVGAPIAPIDWEVVVAGNPRRADRRPSLLARADPA